MDIQDFSTNLKAELATHKVAAFIGAGLSMGAGLPSWYTLINELGQRVKYELPPPQWINGDALIDAAQYYINQQGLHSLVMFLKDRLDTTDKKPSAAHHALAYSRINLSHPPM